jgi:hypothetical protein
MGKNKNSCLKGFRGQNSKKRSSTIGGEGFAGGLHGDLEGKFG